MYFLECIVTVYYSPTLLFKSHLHILIGLSVLPAGCEQKVKGGNMFSI